MRITKDLGLRWWQHPLLHFVVFAGLLIGVVHIVVSKLVLGQGAAMIVVALSMGIPLLLFGLLLSINFSIIARSVEREHDFLSLASHQLRTPISALRWLFNGVEHRFKKDPEHAINESTLNDTHEAIRTIANIVGTLLETSRIDAGRLRLYPMPINLTLLTQRMVVIYELLFNKKSLQINVQTIGPSVSALGDEARILLVIQNFIENAIQYTPRNKSVIIIIDTTTKGQVKWSIKDEGFGIPSNEQKYIFKKYYRAKNARAERPGGTGVGLYVARGIVEHLHGRIGFISAFGRGTTFWFELPAAQK